MNGHTFQLCVALMSNIALNRFLVPQISILNIMSIRHTSFHRECLCHSQIDSHVIYW
jgi:hypothetical protein